MDWVNIFIFLYLCTVTSSVLISSPFDNFRIECPNKSGAQRITIKMAESEGRLRQDTVFSLSCNPISEIYPWDQIPQGVQDIEREDCQYTSMFDPIMDTNVSFTCKEREYIAGISRVTDTRIQMMCCKIRSRDEGNCQTVRFGKPYGTSVKAEIQLDGKLINAFGIEQNLYKVRFCDLRPRAIADILKDEKRTTTRIPTTITSTPSSSTTTRILTSTPSSIPTTKPALVSTTEAVLLTTTGSEVINHEAASGPIPDNNKNEKESLIEFNSSDVEKSIISPATSQKEERINVTPAPLMKENMFPSDKDYENIEEAEAELMLSIADMMKAKAIAENIISKVRASGVKQQMKEKQKEMAEELLHEIEQMEDPKKADELFKASVEILNELSETKKIMSSEELSKEIQKQDDEKKKIRESFERRKAEDSDETDVFEKEILPSARIIPPHLHKSNQKHFTLTSDSSHIDPFHDEDRDITLSNNHNNNNNVVLSTTILPILTRNNILLSPHTTTHNSIDNNVDVLTTTTTIPRLLKKKIKKLIKKKVLKPVETVEPVVEDHSPEFLIAASHSAESRRAPIRRYESTLPPFDNFPSPPPSRYRKPLELPRYIENRRPLYVEPLNDFEEYDELFRNTPLPSYVPRRPLPTTRHPPVYHHSDNNRYKHPEQPYVDEDTSASPFEDPPVPRFRPSPPREPSNEIIETEEDFIATANPRFRRPISPSENNSPFEDVRRSPYPRGPITMLKDYNDISKTPLTKEERMIASSMPTIDDNEALEAKFKMNKDGVKNYKPQKPMKLTDEMLKEMEEMISNNDSTNDEQQNVETLVPMNSVDKDLVNPITPEVEVTTQPSSSTTTTPEETTASTTTEAPSTPPPTTTPEILEVEYIDDELTTTTERTTTDTPYDPAVFYHTVPVRRPKKERYLTFCTKDLAIRDAQNMIVACGDNLEEWYPPRCPSGTSCFMTEDSTFRICCPVSNG